MICNRIRFCELIFACNLRLVTRTSDDSTRLDANDSKFFLCTANWLGVKDGTEIDRASPWLAT
jgi:hypothetical protein